MEYKQLKYFLAVCEEQSFSAAAEKRFISQQGISKSIAKLEQEIGAPLFVRVPGGVRLTEQGMELRRHAQSQLRQWEYICNQVRGAGSETPSLRIGFDIGTLELLPLDFIQVFLENHRDVDMRMSCFNEIQCERLVADHQLDVGFALAHVEGGLCRSVISSLIPMRIIVGKGHPFFERESICLEELRGQRLCDLNTPTKEQRALRLRCKELGIVPQITVNGAEGLFMTDLCRRGLAVSFYAGPESWLPPDVRCVDISDLNVEWGYEMLIPLGSELPPLAREFVDYAMERLSTADESRRWREGRWDGQDG